MEIKTEYYKRILNQFIREYPMFANDIADCVPKHTHAIRVTLRNGEQIDYNAMTSSFRAVKQRDTSAIVRVSDEECREIFANNLSEFMRMRGIGQAYLAERTGLSSAIISKYLNRQATPGITNLINIARVLNCHVDELLE